MTYFGKSRGKTYGKTPQMKGISSMQNNFNTNLQFEMGNMYAPPEVQAQAFAKYLKEDDRFNSALNTATTSLIADETGGRDRGDAMALSQMLGMGGDVWADGRGAGKLPIAAPSIQNAQSVSFQPPVALPPMVPPLPPPSTFAPELPPGFNPGMFGPEVTGGAELMFNQPPPMLPPAASPEALTQLAGDIAGPQSAFGMGPGIGAEIAGETSPGRPVQLAPGITPREDVDILQSGAPGYLPESGSMGKINMITSFLKTGHETGNLDSYFRQAMMMAGAEPDANIRAILQELVSNYRRELTGDIPITDMPEIGPDGEVRDVSIAVPPPEMGMPGKRDDVVTQPIVTPRDTVIGGDTVEVTGDDEVTDTAETGRMPITYYMSRDNADRRGIWDDRKKEDSRLRALSPRARDFTDKKEKQWSKQYNLQQLDPQSEWFYGNQDKDYDDFLGGILDKTQEAWNPNQWKANFARIYEAWNPLGEVPEDRKISGSITNYLSGYDLQNEADIKELGVAISAFADKPETVAGWAWAMEDSRTDINPRAKQIRKQSTYDGMLAWARDQTIKEQGLPGLALEMEDIKKEMAELLMTEFEKRNFNWLGGI